MKRPLHSNHGEYDKYWGIPGSPEEGSVRIPAVDLSKYDIAPAEVPAALPASEPCDDCSGEGSYALPELNELPPSSGAARQESRR